MTNVISTTITAVDRATAVVNRVNASFEGMNRRLAVVSAAGERFGKAVTKFGEVSGITRVGQGFAEVGRHVAGAAESLGRFAPALAGITGAASIAGLAKLVETWTGFGVRLGLDATRIGMSAQSLHGLQGAARLAGSSAEALTDGMRTLGDNLTDAVGGRSPETVVMLSTLGIGFRDAATGGARLAQDVLPEIAKKITSIRNPTLRALAATRLFGAAGESLIPYLKRIAEGTAASSDEMARYGVINQTGVDAANAMREAQVRMGLAVEGVGYAVAERLAPVLVPLLNRLSDWVAAHREDIAAFFTRMATQLQGWADSDGPQHLIDGLTALGTEIGEVVTALGGWKTAAVVVGLAMFAGPIASVLALIYNIGRLLVSVGALTLAVGTKLVTAFGLADTAMTGFSNRALANPVFRTLTLALGVLDRLGAGIPTDQMTPEMRERFGVPPPATVPGSAAEEPDNRTWWERHAPPGLGGRPAPGGRAGSGEGGSGGASPALPEGERAVRARAAYDQFRGAGDPPNIAAARVAVIEGESRNFDPREVGDGGEAQGQQQLHPDRQAQFAERYHHPVREGTAAEQLEFFHDDPDARSQGALRLLRNNPGMPADQAAGLLVQEQQRPADIPGEMRRRGARALQLEQRFRAEDAAQARVAPPVPGAPPPMPAPPVSAPPPPMSPPVAPPPGPQASAAGLNGTVGVNIAFLNQPPGLRTTTTTEGNVTVRAPRIDYAMPGWAPV